MEADFPVLGPDSAAAPAGADGWRGLGYLGG